MSRHKNPTDPRRSSLAPYNFIALPERVYTPGDAVKIGGHQDPPWKAHDRYLEGARSGWIDLKIRAERPLYVRCAPAVDQAAPEDSRANRHRQDFFHHGDPEAPVLPGSSLRGMTRALIEILGHGSLRWFSNRRLVHRAVGDSSSLGTVYREQFLGEPVDPNAHPPLYEYPSHRVRGGHLRVHRGDWYIQPAREVHGESLVLVEYDAAEQGAGIKPRRSSDKGRYGSSDVVRVWLKPPTHREERTTSNQQARLRMARVADAEHVRRRNETDDAPPKPGFEAAFILRSGHMGGKKSEKHRHCAVYAPDPERQDSGSWLSIDPDVRRDYEEDRERQRGIPCRKIKNDSDPLVYLVDEDGKVAFFGPTLFFRLPHTRRVSSFIPEAARGADALELADALFGTVDGPEGAVKGRVFFEDAPWAGPEEEREAPSTPFLAAGDDGLKSPKILSGPKPTAFQHYLAQPRPDSKKSLEHWSSSPDATELRGLKRYWHKPRAPEGEPFEDEPKPESTQHTIIRPVRPGTRFQGRVRFENLSDLELGALLTALQLPPTKRHHLGMGKPLGMGSARIETTLHLVDRGRRYSRLLAEDGTAETGELGADEAANVMKAALSTFERAILDHASEPGHDRPDTLWKLPRLRQLAALLEWDGAPPPEQTAYAPGGAPPFKWWRERPVLPDPEAVLAGTAGTAATGRRRQASRSRGGRKGGGGTPEPAPQGAPVLRDEFSVGQRVRVVVQEETTKKGKPRFQVAGSSKQGVLHPQSPEPPDLTPGKELELVVKAPGSTLQLAWPEAG